jgi:hypothetical protein
VLHVALDPGLPGGRFACLRELCGHDEVAVDDTSDLAATLLLSRLLVAAPGTRVGPEAAWDLPIPDRDRLLAAIYRHQYGERVESSVACQGCGAPFDLEFDLDRLTRRLERPERPSASGPDDEGTYRTDDGRRFRLPNGADLRSVVGLEPERAVAILLERCVVEGDANADRERIEAAMAAVGPTLDLDLDATCPECELAQPVRFAMHLHLLALLAAERVWLAHEVHAIATAYGWSLQEILALTREDRHAYVRLIEADRGSRWRDAP